ncbi:MAG: UvrD-helicase domain-containing protein [Bacteroidia bacterium]
MKPFNQLTIYRSSAGSGKTYTLVKEYLKIALAQPAFFHQVLAITFTNKAADEMKTRIIKTLVEFTEGKNEELKSELKKILNVSEEVFIENSKRLLNLILHRYSEFAVCTIDSFFHRIIRSLSKEMGIPLTFETELNEPAVISEIISRLFNSLNNDRALSKWLQDFMLSKMNEDKGWNIERELQVIAQQLFREEFRAFHKSHENISEEFIKQLRAIKNTFESEMKSFGNEFIEGLKKYNLSVQNFSYGKSGVAGYLIKITKRIPAGDYIPKARAIEANQFSEKWVSKSAQNREQIVLLVENNFSHILKKVIDHYEKNFEEYNTTTEVLNLIYIAGIVNKLDEKLREFRDENDILLISDINLLLKDFISGTDIPFVYEKTGNRYKHFLVDEFQDTSSFQWINLMPLIENSLADGSSAMMVGDAKQSIYRWRGGNMQLLMNGIQNDLKHYASITKTENLQTNFRSKKEIVNFNNRFFSVAPNLLPLDDITDENKKSLVSAFQSDEVKQEVTKKNSSGGLVEILLYNKSEINKEDEEESNQNEIVLKHLLATIDKLKIREVAEKDICILVRTNRQGNEISKFLFENGIKKIVSSESLLINRSPQIIFLINLFKLLNNPEDKIARAECIYYHLTHSETKPKDSHSVFSLVNDEKLFFQSLPLEFSLHFDRLKKLPLYELAEQLTGIFKLNSRPDAFVQRFHDMVLDFLDKNSSSLSLFLDWWGNSKDARNASVIIPSNENAIRIVSIHKAKGLQFPSVIIPFTDWKLKPDSRDTLWVHPSKKPFLQYSSLPVRVTGALEKSYFKNEYQEELHQTLIDNLNLLYVAFTRAERELYLICPDAKTDSINRASQLICKTINSVSEWKDSIKEGKECKILSLGLKQKIAEKEITQKDSETSFDNPAIVPLEKYNSNPWQSKLVIAINKNKISINGKEAEKTEFGIFIHKLFSKIILGEDAPKALSDSLKTGVNFENQEKDVRQMIDDVLKICKQHKWFTKEWEIKTEAEMILPNGNVIRPDRVMIKNNNVVLLDYKTGDEDVLHKKQLDEYEKVLIESGYTNVEKYLLYLKEMKLIKIE